MGQLENRVQADAASGIPLRTSLGDCDDDASTVFAVGPVTWLLLQALSVVASILLAFAIDAWWDARTEGAEKNELLTAFRKELVPAARSAQRGTCLSTRITRQHQATARRVRGGAL